jgi:acyl carrier protein
MIFDKIKKTIGAQLAIGEEEMHEGTTFDDLGIDSLEIIEIIISLEETFEIEVPNEDIADIKNLGDMTKYIQNKVDHKVVGCGSTL